MGPGEDTTLLREAIGDIDRSLLELLRRRMSLAAEIGRLKSEAGRPILVSEVHDRVLTRARQHARSCGVSENVMEAIFDAVMRGSVERQHRVGVSMRARVGRRMLILGGAGNMGGWFAEFADLVGHRVDIVDPAMKPLPEELGRYPSLDAIEDLTPYDAILVAVPLDRTSRALEALIDRAPQGLIIEISSIKSHLTTALDLAEQSDVVISCLHPMFGPGKSPYEPLTFVVACRRDPQEETSRLERVLRHPYTQLIPVPFAHHDRLMGWLLGLAHLSGMLFGCALTRSGLAISELEACASTTYDRQADTASSVLLEDPDLYYDIQRLNPHRGEVYKAASEALSQLVEAVESDDRETFRELLSHAESFLAR